MINKYFKGNIFKQDDEYFFTIAVNETSGLIADDVIVTFEVKDCNTINDPDNVTNLSNVTLSEDTLSTGTFALNVWNIGTIVSGSGFSGTFKLTMIDNDVSNIVVKATVTTTSNETDISNNVGLYTWEGVRYDEVINSISDAEIKSKYENNADTNAFTDAKDSKLFGIETGAQVNPTPYIDTFVSSNITHSNTNVVVGGNDAKAEGVNSMAQGHSRVEGGSNVALAGSSGSNTIGGRPTYLNEIKNTQLSVISGGGDNLIDNSIASNISGGAHNTILNGGGHNGILSGSQGWIEDSSYSCILNGIDNQVLDSSYSQILGSRLAEIDNSQQSSIISCVSTEVDDLVNSAVISELRSNGQKWVNINQCLVGASANSQGQNLNQVVAIGGAGNTYGTVTNVVENSGFIGGFNNDIADLGVVRYSGGIGGRDVQYNGQYGGFVGGQGIIYNNNLHSGNLGGKNHTFSSGVINSVALGSDGITISKSNTAYSTNFEAINSIRLQGVSTTGSTADNGSIFKGTNGSLYYKGDSGTVTQIAVT